MDGTQAWGQLGTRADPVLSWGLFAPMCPACEPVQAGGLCSVLFAALQ